MAIVLRSPSSASSSSYSYDVFLNFRGEDTRRTFTDHLYTALNQAGIRTFRDDDAIERARQLKPEFEKAIQQSEISLIVFSKSYATSKWCLDEVLMIMKKYDGEVVPVFYNIEPTDVRNQTGCFEDAFKGYDDEVKRETDVEKKKELSDKVKAWRESLRKAGSLAGMVSKDGYEAEFISNIVKVIRKKLNYNTLYIENDLVGITGNVAEIESWLQDPSPNASILIIAGMGGIGKTTIAKFIYNSNFREYDGSSFLANINQASSQPNGMLRLQSQFLSEILKSKKKERVWNEYQGTTKIANAICNKKVLMVLDDVTTSQQLNILLGQRRFFPGSKVIITTRHTSLSTAFREPLNVQTIKTLSYIDSKKLFCLHVFHQDQPIEAYINQVEEAIHYCEGLPLALEVLGSTLRGKNIVEWKDAMSKLKKNPLQGIQNVLQLSYDYLDDHDKDLFLHIACFFVGEDEDWVVKLLVECNLNPIIGIRNLKDCCLLYVEKWKMGKEKRKVEMHQLIREMGQEVVRQESPKYPGHRSRLWSHDDCLNVLQENVGTEKVEGLLLDMHVKSTSAITIDNPKKRKHLKETVGNFIIGALENMRNLMLLQLNYAKVSGKYKRLPKKLRLLRWHGFSLKCIPFDIPLEKLVALDMSYSRLHRVWDGFKIIESLKFLNLSYSLDLIKTPDFRGLPRLESLVLKECISLTEVDESIAYLKELVLLDLTDCRSLINVPCVPKSVVSLHMSGCPILGAVGGFQGLESISLAPCLVNLQIADCNLYDSSFPNDLSSLVSLDELNIGGNYITSLPKCIQSLPKLRVLDANVCPHIQSIIGLPETLQKLDITENMSLMKVKLPAQSFIRLDRCPKLREVVGFHEWQSVDKVERKEIQNPGLQLELDYSSNKQKVLSKYGLFSTPVSEEEIPPPSFFTFKESGPRISFTVHSNHRLISGFSFCLVLSPYISPLHLRIKVCNKTKNMGWINFPGVIPNETPEGKKVRGWLGLWKTAELLHNGDQISLDILKGTDDCKEVEECREVEEFCIKLIYEEKEEEEHNIEEQVEGGNEDENINDKVVMSEYIRMIMNKME